MYSFSNAYITVPYSIVLYGDGTIFKFSAGDPANANAACLKSSACIGWPPKLPKRINLPIFVPQSSPKRPPPKRPNWVYLAKFGGGVRVPPSILFSSKTYLPIYMLDN